MYESEIYRDLPHLVDTTNHALTSPKDDYYNCIAWAAGDTNAWWWPSSHPAVFWPAGVPKVATVETFSLAFAKLGYQPCANRDLDPFQEKVALYVDANGVPTHMARQLADGQWTSKIGRWHDIQHVSLEVVADGAYGKPSEFFSRHLANR